MEELELYLYDYNGVKGHPLWELNGNRQVRVTGCGIAA
jgi:hypothetical protein